MVQSLQRAKQLERKKLNLELKKYQQGRIQAEQVIRAQDALILAESRNIQAWKNYLNSRLSLMQARGVLIEGMLK